MHYRGAGTIEFLYDEDARDFYFLEMNTRIQVEHPVTEFVTGIDLVREMIRIAGGEKLRLRQDDVRMRGHAIEVRINAEDPARNFMPFPGIVNELQRPGGHGVRFDTMLYSGYSIPPFYDSLLGKLIVWDENRASRHRTPERRSARTRDHGRQDDQSHCIRRWPPMRTSRAGRFDTQLARALARTPRLSGWHDRGGGGIMKTRYSFGGDEHIFVEVDEDMSLEAFFTSLSITNAVRDSRIKGVTEICPANASFQIKFDPELITPGRHAGRNQEARDIGGESRFGADDAHHRDSGATTTIRGRARR